jgi:hypothetical protein
VTTLDIDPRPAWLCPDCSCCTREGCHGRPGADCPTGGHGTCPCRVWEQTIAELARAVCRLADATPAYLAEEKMMDLHFLAGTLRRLAAGDPTADLQATVAAIVGRATWREARPPLE